MLKHLNRKEVEKEYRSMVRKVEMFREKRKNPSQNKIASTIIPFTVTPRRINPSIHRAIVFRKICLDEQSNNHRGC